MREGSSFLVITGVQLFRIETKPFRKVLCQQPCEDIVCGHLEMDEDTLQKGTNKLLNLPKIYLQGI